jgi:hypothetical protein
MTMPLPRRVAELIGQVPSHLRHPGLSLDKHVDPPKDAKDQKPILERVRLGFSDQLLLDSLNGRREQSLTDAIMWLGKIGVR